VIVVIGALAWRATEPVGPAGRGCEVALGAAAAGARVEIVGRVGDDPVGDTLLIALARASVGHAAVLRDPVRPTPIALQTTTDDEDPFAEPDDSAGPGAVDGMASEGEDVGLGLRYLTEVDVLVGTDDVPRALLPGCDEAAAFAGARLVILVSDVAVDPDLPPDALVLGVPDSDDGAFGALVGRLCAGLDAGLDSADALRAAAGHGGWEAVHNASA